MQVYKNFQILNVEANFLYKYLQNFVKVFRLITKYFTLSRTASLFITSFHQKVHRHFDGVDLIGEMWPKNESTIIFHPIGSIPNVRRPLNGGQGLYSDTD